MADKNQLYYGDNLDVLRRYVRDGSVDLVYLDPPFNSRQDYNVLFAEKDGSRSSSQIHAFEDTWEWNLESQRAYEGIVETGGRVADTMAAFHKFLADTDMMAYLAMMAPRLVELRLVKNESATEFVVKAVLETDYWYSIGVTITGGPYLHTAVFCDRVLREVDGIVSLIRIVDRWTVAGPAEQMATTLIQTHLAILMKSGTYRGAAKIQVTPTSPSGVEMTSLQLPVNFEGDDDRGVAIALPIAFPVQEPGVYWFDIQISGQSLTKIPLRVLYQQIAMQPRLPMA